MSFGSKLVFILGIMPFFSPPSCNLTDDESPLIHSQSSPSTSSYSSRSFFHNSGNAPITSHLLKL
ncbi:MAG: hypothetical protein WCK67_10400 [bacterium]